MKTKLSVKNIFMMALVLLISCNKGSKNKDVGPGVARDFESSEISMISASCSALDRQRKVLASQKIGSSVEINIFKNTCDNQATVYSTDTSAFYAENSNGDIVFDSSIDLCETNKVVFTNKVDPIKSLCNNVSSSKKSNQIKDEFLIYEFAITTSGSNVNTMNIKQYAQDLENESQYILNKEQNIFISTDSRSTDYGKVKTFERRSLCEDGQTWALCRQVIK